METVLMVKWSVSQVDHDLQVKETTTSFHDYLRYRVITMPHGHGERRKIMNDGQDLLWLHFTSLTTR